MDTGRECCKVGVPSHVMVVWSYEAKEDEGGRVVHV